MSSIVEDRNEVPRAVTTEPGNGGGGGEPRRPGILEALRAYLRGIKHSPRIESL